MKYVKAFEQFIADKYPKVNEEEVEIKINAGGEDDEDEYEDDEYEDDEYEDDEYEDEEDEYEDEEDED